MVVNLIIPIAYQSAGELAVHQLSPESQGDTFVIRLSANGQEPASHVACQPIVIPATYAAMQSLQASGQFGTVLLTVSDGEPFASFEQTAFGAGLQRIIQEKP